MALGAPRIALSGSGKTPYTTPSGLRSTLRTRPLYYPARSGIPNYTEGVITPSPGRPETSVSPTWASAVVTGTFSNCHNVFLSLRQTLPDSADLPTGHYDSNMDPFQQEPQLPDNPTLQETQDNSLTLAATARGHHQQSGNLLRRHTRLLGNPEPPSTTCFVHNIQSPS